MPQSHDAIVSAGTYAVTDFALATPPPAATTLSFIATADAELSQTSPTKNAGTASSFRIRAGTPSSPSTYVDYLKFTVSGLAGQTPSGVKLRLYNTDASDDGGSVVAAGNGWTETGITWANAPATTGSALGAAGPVAVSQWADDRPDAGRDPGGRDVHVRPHQPQLEQQLLPEPDRCQQADPRAHDRLRSAAPPPPPPPPPTGPTAAFTATPTTGPAPLAVTVTDGSTGAPTSWSWDFGDGTTSTLAAPATHSYTSPGTYTLRLTVANAGGSSSATRTVTVAAAPPPPPPASRIASMTFEAGRLVDPTTGATKVSGTATLVTAAPLVGVDSAGISSSTAYLERSWTANDDVYVSAVIRFAARPTGAVRVLQISNAGTTVGNLQLQPNGALRLRKDSTTIGVDSAPLSAGVAYRIAIHQKRGTGADAVLEGFVAPLGTGLGTPFASQLEPDLDDRRRSAPDRGHVRRGARRRDRRRLRRHVQPAGHARDRHAARLARQAAGPGPRGGPLRLPVDLRLARRRRATRGSGAVALHEPADPADRVLELLVRGRVAGPDVALPARPERRARDHRDPLLGQQSLGEGLRRQAGRGRHLGEGVERAARLERPEPEAR